MTERPRVLFLCTGNACRSQMAEGLCRALHGDVFEVASAGLKAHGLDPRAVAAMAEIGIDISHHTSKTLDALGGARFDVVITVCDHANEHCPLPPPGARHLHAGFDDPPRLAREASSDEDAMRHYRRVRDDIRTFVRDLPQTLGHGTGR